MLTCMPRPPVVPTELQRGPFTLDEARRAGLTRRQLHGANWRRVGYGLYVWSGLAESTVQSLAAIRRRLPMTAAFSGRTAAWLHCLDLPPCDPVEVTIPPESGVAARTGLSVRRSSLSPEEVVQRHGLPSTSALRTVVDLAAGLEDLTEAVVVADMALHARLVDLPALSAYASAHAGRKGVAQLRRVIELVEPAAESAMETRLRLLLVLAGLPRPRAQASLHDERGHFLGRADLYYADQRLALEYDGGTHRDRLAEDDRRQNRILAAGIRMLRFTAADVYRGGATVVAQVRAAVARTPTSRGAPT
jgi:very-short-patch-repair endonuclease